MTTNDNLTTDEKILWLCEHGFTLPDGLTCQQEDGLVWLLDVDHPEHYVPILSIQAHDLCAAHFAREQNAKPDDRHMRVNYTLVDFYEALETGQTAAAIDALYRAVKGIE